MQRLEGSIILALRVPRVVEAACKQQVGELREQRLEVQVVEEAGDEARIPVLHA